MILNISNRLFIGYIKAKGGCLTRPVLFTYRTQNFNYILIQAISISPVLPTFPVRAVCHPSALRALLGDC